MELVRATQWLCNSVLLITLWLRRPKNLLLGAEAEVLSIEEIENQQTARLVTYIPTASNTYCTFLWTSAWSLVFLRRDKCVFVIEGINLAVLCLSCSPMLRAVTWDCHRKGMRQADSFPKNTMNLSVVCCRTLSTRTNTDQNYRVGRWTSAQAQ